MSLCAKIFAKHGNTLRVTNEGYETGHEPVHRSSSGTCVKINDVKDLWHCTNPDCSAGGGSISALMSLEGLSYDEAEAQVQAMGGVVKPRPPKIASFILNDKGKPRALVANVLKVLEHNPSWAQAIRYNSFKDAVEVCKPLPPYAPDELWDVQSLSEELTTELTAWIQETYELYIPSSLLWEGLHAFARTRVYHPVCAYLSDLEWDGKKRLDTWLTTYCHVEQTDYSRAVGRITLIAAVARAFEPGCKMDTVTILEGLQGWLKSWVWRILASDEWFTDTLPDLHTKDAAQALRGKWFIEFAELDHFKRAEIETIKRFISATQDHYRPAYGRRAITYPRSTVFVGTTNKQTYLLDETGNRRYLPVRVTASCDLEALRRDRDQLWAEAMHEYRHDAQWYIDDPDLLQQAEVEQADRMEDDPWAEAIHTYLDTRKKTQAKYRGDAVEYVTTGEVLSLALHVEQAQWTTGASRRVAAVLRLARWDYKRVDLDKDDNENQRTQIKAFIRPLTTASSPRSSPETDEPDTPPSETDASKRISPHQSLSESDESDESDDIEIIETPSTTPTRARAVVDGCVEDLMKTTFLSASSVSEPVSPLALASCTETDQKKHRSPKAKHRSPKAPETDTPPVPVVVRPTIDPGNLEYVLTAEQAHAALQAFHGQPLIGIDIETTDLDPLIGHIRLVQLAIPGRTVVLDLHHVPAEVLQPLLSSSSRFVGHNLKFELRHLAATNLPWPAHLSDTMHLAQILGASGDNRPKGYYSLEGVVDRELNLFMDKTLQLSDWSGELSHEQILYAARDAASELPLYHPLTTACTKAQLERIRALEEACLPALVWMEQAGVLVDEAAWQDRADRDVLEVGIVVADLCMLLHEATLAGTVLPLTPEAVNWSSPKQVLAVLQALGAEDLTSTAELVLTQLAPDYPLAAKLLDHRHLSQRIKNGGAKWLRQYIHPITHRVHADYLQTGTRAGRMSCARPNMQQIPKSKDYRTSIIAGPGQVLLKADYSQIELRVAAAIAPEPVMLEALRAGEDLHRRTAAYVLGCDPTTVTDEQRNLAKALNFGLLYGMGVLRLQQQARKDYGVALTLDAATQHREAFFHLYPGLRSWHRATGTLLDFERSIDIRTLLGRRRTNVQKYTEALNTPVQGAAADGFKLAVAQLYEHRHEAPDARLIMCVHDEIVVECPATQAEETSAWLHKHMQTAMEEAVQQKVPIEVEVKSGKDWVGTAA